MNERDIFLAAIEIADPAQRATWVKQACGTDTGLQAQVEALLKTHAQSSQFLESPAAAKDSSVAQTIVTSSSEADDDPGTERTTGEAEFRRYLQPATRPGWLGRLAHYEIEAILGRGAFGIVAKAFDEKLHRVVAIKLMNPELASTSPPRKRFLREARTAAAVTHENIVAIYAVEEEPIPYLVMEYIPGQTLQQRMDARGPFEVPVILRIGQQVAAGLAAAQSVKLIHRDIKPSNILLADGPTERAKISDFGLARAVDDATMTSSGMIAGTPMYMAPEQARGEPLDHRSDLFSLGSVLYQMASGRPPFRAANTVAVLKRVCEDTPRSLDDVVPGIPDWLETIIFKLLEKKREDRYQTAQEVADLLARCQRELEHNGHVTCVKGRHVASETQEFHVKRPISAAAKEKSIGWLVGGVMTIAALIGLMLLYGGKKTPDPDLTRSSSITTPETLAKPTDQAGWQGWPTDAPKPAIAPFDTVQAKKHQEEWAKYLKAPVEYTNSIGMKFVLIPPGEFLMGSTQAEILSTLAVIDRNNKHLEDCLQSESPRHRVTVSRPFYLGTTEVSQSQFQKVVGRNPSYFASSGSAKEFVQRVANLDTADFPVEGVSRVDAIEFCEKLSQQEKLSASPDQIANSGPSQFGAGYRLPTEAEWELACRAGTTTRSWTGDLSDKLYDSAWFMSNSGLRTHRTGELPANPFGLHDMHGNVWEWVIDDWDPAAYGRRAESSVRDPLIRDTSLSKGVVRGGAWSSRDADCRSSSRLALDETYRNDFFGFRVAISVEAVQRQLQRDQGWTKTDQGWHGWPADAPKPAIASFDAAQAKRHQEEWAAYLKIPVEHTNSLGMKFRLIPPGEFTMGSTLEEMEEAVRQVPNDKQWREALQSAVPEHKVILTQPIYLGETEVTQAEYEKLMGKNPSNFAKTGQDKQLIEKIAGLDTADHPVEMVSWNDAAEFCAKLSQQEQLKPFYLRSGDAITPQEGTGYRLPSEAEWEFACRAGSATKYWVGDQDEELVHAGWFAGNSGMRTHAVGELKANPFGLYDIHGNVWEWVQDGWDATSYGEFRQKSAINPNEPFSTRPLRVVRGGGWFASASRCRSSFRIAGSLGIGFRVSLAVDAVRQAVKGTSTVVSQPMGQLNSTDVAAESKAARFYARQREIAEFVQSRGGSLYLVDHDGWVKPNMLLPKAEFVIQHVNLGEDNTPDSRLKPGEIAKLLPLPCAHHFSIPYARADQTDARQLAQLKSVYHLNLAHSTIKTSWLPELVGLIEIAVSADMVDDAWQFTTRYPALRSLHLDVVGQPLPDLKPLGHLPGLRYLNLWGAEISPQDVAELQQHNPSLRIISNSRLIGRDPVKEACQKLLETKAVVSGYDINDPLRNQHRLTAEMIDSNKVWQITNVEFSAESTATPDKAHSLTTLAATISDISIDGLPDGERWTKLLADVRYQHAVKLSHSDLTDAGLLTLARRGRIRAQLDIRGNPQVTAVGVAAFHRALPVCRILSDHGEIAPDYIAEPEVPDADTPGPNGNIYAHERAVAEFVLSRGGNVFLDNVGRVTPGTPLPKNDFILANIEKLVDDTLTPDDLDRLGGTRRIHALAIESRSLDSQAGRRLTQFGNVYDLCVHCPEIKTSSFPELSGVISLSIWGMMVDDNFAFLKRCQTLRQLIITDQTGDLSSLGDNPQLRTVTARDNPVDDDLVRRLQQKNPRLRLFGQRDGRYRVIGNDPVVAAATRLIQNGCEVRGLNWGQFLNGGETKETLLTQSLLEDDGPWRVIDVRLEANGSATSDTFRELNTFAGELGTVMISNQQHCDDLARELSELQYLWSLKISNSDLTNTGLKSLQVFDRLRYLDILGNPKITADGVQAFHRAVPYCRILSDHGEILPDFLAAPMR